MPASADSVEVRWAEARDSGALAGLVDQVKRHYGEELGSPGAIEAAVSSWLEPKAGHGLFAIAFVDGEPAGFANVAVVYPAMGLAGALYMKELFVSAAMRSHGIGHRLMVFLAGYCLAEKIERIDLTTAVDNDAGIRFYEREGSSIQRQKISLRFETESLEKLAAANGDD